MPHAPNVVLRERLVTALDQRWSGGLGLLMGGPGLGKSTLLRQSMLESATLGRGGEFLVRCRSDWTASSVHAAVCGVLQMGEGPTLGEPNATAITENLWSAAPDRLGLVFDDLHLLDESGLAYVLELREALPTNGHLLIALRENPLLTALLMTADPSLIIDGEDLLFTDAEVEQFAAATGSDAAALQRAGGWPAVLALTASAGNDVAGAYLYQKVLAGLSRSQQGDLAVAAALGELDESVARQVLEGTPRDLAQVPLVDTTPAGGIIVHDLWQTPLAGLVDPQRLVNARLLAADHAESLGDVDRAVSILMGAGLAAQARGVIIRHVSAGADRVPVDRVDRWLRLVTSPDQALLRQLLQLLRGGLVRGSLTDLELEQITARCRDAGELDLEALVCDIDFAVAWSADRSDDCIAIANRLTALHSQGVAEAAHGRFMAEVTAARRDGDNERVLAVIHDARREQGVLFGEDWNTSLELETLVALGRPFEALELVELAEDRLAERKVRSVTYGLTYWFAGRPEAALQSLDAILAEPGRFDGLERSWRATSTLFRHYRGLEADGGLPEFPGEDERFSLYSRVCEGLTSVAEAANDGREEEAAALVGDLAERLPPTGGFTLQAWFMGASLWYVLRPEDRALLDAFMSGAGNIYGQASALVRSFVMARETGAVPDELVDQWPTPDQVGTLLPARWAAEIALRIGEGRPGLRDAILDGLESHGHLALQRLAEADDADIAQLAALALGERPNAPGDLVTVRLFGAPLLDVPHHDDPPDWRRGRVRALFGLLAHRGRVSRDAATEALWPDLDPQAGRRNLRVTLSYLTKALEPDRVKTAPPWFVYADGESLELRTDGMSLDIAEFRHCLADADAHRKMGVATGAIDALRRGVSLYAGPFLEGVDDEWVVDARAELQRQGLDACLRLVALLRAGRSDDAATWARRAVEIDPLSIDALEELIASLEGGPPHELDRARADLRALLDELA